jgi:hypothetical protein
MKIQKQIKLKDEIVQKRCQIQLSEFPVKPHMEFALSDDKQLYFKGSFSGISFSDWCLLSKTSIGLTLEELETIHKKLLHCGNNDELLKRHVFVFDEMNSGGEALMLVTKFYGNGDKVTKNDGVYLNQELELCSYCNSASFNLCGTNFTPENLRELANQLEQERNKLVK